MTDDRSKSPKRPPKPPNWGTISEKSNDKGRLEPSGAPMTGRILKIVRGEGSGIIRASRGGKVFFHRTDTADTFNQLEVGDRVTFELIDDRISGPRAIKVRKV